MTNCFPTKQIKFLANTNFIGLPIAEEFEGLN